MNYTKTVKETKTIVNDVVTEKHTDMKHKWLCDDGDGETICFTISDGFLAIENGTTRVVTVATNDDVVTVLKGIVKVYDEQTTQSN